MSLKVAIVVQNESFYDQIQQLLQDIDICYVDRKDEPDIIITDGHDKTVYEMSKDNICTVFSIVLEKPNDVSESPQHKFYIKGEISPKQFAADVKCWDSIYSTIRYLNTCANDLMEQLDDVTSRYQEHESLMAQSTEWQTKALLPELGNDFLYHLDYNSALFASGDFVCTKDFDDCTFFIVGDVSGHGISDALVGASFKGNIDTYIELKGSDAKLDELISYLQKHKDCFFEKNNSENSPIPYSVHILATKLNKKDFSMEICSVGYGDAPPLFISGNSVQVYECKASEVIPPIGEYDLPPVVVNIPFHPGDGMILCSDGYTEAFVMKNKQDKQYEYKPKRLAESARRAVLHNIHWTPQDVSNEINADLHHYILSSLSEGQRASHDDTTLLVIKWLAEK